MIRPDDDVNVPSEDEIADFYEVVTEDVTPDMRRDYLHDLQEDYQTRGL